MINRTPENICLLCNENYATTKNSHFTPAALIATAVGKRDYEDSKRIDAGGEKPLDSFYGRANLNNADTTHKPHHHAADYIFCPECEKKLSVIESEINPILTKKIKDQNHASSFPFVSKNELKIISCKSTYTKIFFLYFYSIIWRQSLQQRLEKEGTVVLSKDQEELLRKLLHDSLKLSIKEFADLKFDIIPLIVLTADTFADATTNLICPHSKFVNPFCFLANEFLVIIEFHEPAFHSLPEFFNLDNRIILKELINSSIAEPFKIGIIKEKEWFTFLKHTADHEAVKFINHYAHELNEQTNLGRLKSRAMLCICAKEKNKTSGKLFGEDLVDCFHELTKKYKT